MIPQRKGTGESKNGNMSIEMQFKIGCKNSNGASSAGNIKLK